MKLLSYSVTLQFQAPILVKSSSPSVFGIDAALDRVLYGANSGKCRIPGPALKGKIAESFQQLYPSNGSSREQWIDRLFGKENEPGNLREDTGAFMFDDFIAVSPESRRQNQAQRTRIALNQESGTVMKGAMQVIETPWLAGQSVEFEGKVWAYADPSNPPSDFPPSLSIGQALLQGFSWLTQCGANRGIGFARSLSVAVGAPEPFCPDPEAVDLSQGTFSLEAALVPFGPLCVSKPKIGDNLFESEEFIPGNMLAGAIMETAKALKLDGQLAPYFDQIRFRHAFPSRVDAPRPQAIPLCIAAVDDQLWDASLLREPQPISGKAPAFQPDWKSATWESAEKAWQVVHPAKELRVRTAINSSKRTAYKGHAEEGGKLFAHEVVHPWMGTEPLVWRTQIDLGKISNEEERKRVAQLLGQILTQLGFLSKTKARSTATLKGRSAGPDPELSPEKPLVLVLQTPALLADSRFQTVAGVPASGALAPEELLQLYRETWDQLSDGSLQLSHYFAQQFMTGGNHLAKRFQKSKPYNPWLLTRAGSVFVFHVTETEKARQKLSAWLAYGLDVPSWAQQAFGSSWRSNPYIPQNGFGEIALHWLPQTVPAIPTAL